MAKDNARERQPHLTLLCDTDENAKVIGDLLTEKDRIIGVRADTREGSREFRGDLVVGADGRTSIVRRRSSVSVKQDRVPLDIVWCKVPLPSFMRSDPHLRAYLGHGHLLLCAPTPDERLQLGWKGRDSEFALSPEEVVSRSRPRSADVARGHAHFELASHLEQHGHHEAAVRHFREAHRLVPDSWTFRRQAWSLEAGIEGPLARFWQGPRDDDPDSWPYEGDWLTDVRAVGAENYSERFRP